MLDDADEFKRVNDSYGQQGDDKVLRDLMEHIRKMIRKDDLVGRLGGNKSFVFLHW